MNENSHFWRYNEDQILKEFEEYLISTYGQHYVDDKTKDNTQTIDRMRKDRVEAFCAESIKKYIDRYDRKGTPKADLFKVLHYTVLLINHVNIMDKN